MADFVIVEELLPELERISEEISFRTCFQGGNFEAGIVVFHPRHSADPKYITHSDKDLVCYVIKGSGRLRIDGEERAVAPGLVSHIPKGTPHDFCASGEELLIFYLTIQNP